MAGASGVGADGGGLGREHRAGRQVHSGSGWPGIQRKGRDWAGTQQQGGKAATGQAHSGSGWTGGKV